MPTQQETKFVGKRLALTRRALGYKTQTQFLKALEVALEVAPGRWNHYEVGKLYPPIDVALALCTRFDLSLDWIYRGVRQNLPGYVREALEAQELKDRRSEMPATHT
jgi:transcriptional regulator with XRE-family HTH domain